MKLTYHAQYERADRMARLEETLGFTNTAFEVVHRQARICAIRRSTQVVEEA